MMSYIMGDVTVPQSFNNNNNNKGDGSNESNNTED